MPQEKYKVLLEVKEEDIKSGYEWGSRQHFEIGLKLWYKLESFGWGYYRQRDSLSKIIQVFLFT